MSSSLPQTSSNLAAAPSLPPKAPGEAKISAFGMVKVVSADSVLDTAGALGNNVRNMYGVCTEYVALRERSWKESLASAGKPSRDDTVTCSPIDQSLAQLAQ